MSGSKRRETDDSGSKKTVLAALAANLGIAVTKFAAALISGSSAMLAEGIHSAIDTLNQVFLLIGMRQAKRPADAAHPFGYAAEIYFWSFLVAILIFALGAGVSVYEGMAKLLADNPEPIVSPWIPITVLGLAFCFEGYSWTVAFKEFNQRRRGEGFMRDFRSMKDPSVFVVLFEDSAACIGIIIAAAGIVLTLATGVHAFDAGASILVGVLLGVTAILLAIEVKGLLIGEAAGPELDGFVRSYLEGKDEIRHVNEIRTLHLGPSNVLVTMSVDFDDDVVSQRIERIVNDVDATVRDRFAIVQEVFVEVQSRRGHRRFADTAPHVDPDAGDTQPASAGSA